MEFEIIYLLIICMRNRYESGKVDPIVAIGALFAILIPLLGVRMFKSWDINYTSNGNNNPTIPYYDPNILMEQRNPIENLGVLPNASAVSPLMQGDARWANIVLGYNSEAKYNIGLVGCNVTAFAMAKNAFGGSLTPADVNTIFSNLGVYTPNSGFIQMNSAAKALGLEYLIENGTIHNPDIQGHISQGYPAIAHRPGSNEHFVMIKRIDEQNEIVYFNDPFTGTERYATFIEFTNKLGFSQVWVLAQTE